VEDCHAGGHSPHGEKSQGKEINPQRGGGKKNQLGDKPKPSSLQKSDEKSGGKNLRPQVQEGIDLSGQTLTLRQIKIGQARPQKNDARSRKISPYTSGFPRGKRKSKYYPGGLEFEGRGGNFLFVGVSPLRERPP